MSTIIGLRSGKEFVVEEQYYPYTHIKTGAVTTVFISVDRKRMITVPPLESPIEFYDEPANDNVLKQLSEVVNIDEPEVGYNDPNIL